MTPQSSAVAAYWNDALHDAAISGRPVGSPGWFDDLAAYRYRKLDYLDGVVAFADWAGSDVLELGCGIGLDLARFAGAGARAAGVDLSARAVELARGHLLRCGLDARVEVADGARTAFAAHGFDLVYCHGVAPYAPSPQALVDEAFRVLRPGGTALFMFYHRDSWLRWTSRVTGTPLEHVDAPYYRMTTRTEALELFAGFADAHAWTERQPVPTELHRGWKAALYNHAFVEGFRRLPTAWTSRWGWHLMVRSIR